MYSTYNWWKFIVNTAHLQNKHRMVTLSGSLIKEGEKTVKIYAIWVSSCYI